MILLEDKSGLIAETNVKLADIGTKRSSDRCTTWESDGSQV